MKRSFLLTLTILINISFADTQELRTTVEQWVGLLEKTQAEKSRWVREQQALESSKDALANELSALKADIDQLKQDIESASLVDQEQLDQREDYEQARKVLGEGLDALMPKVPALLALVPDSLAASNTKISSFEIEAADLKKAGEGKELGRKLNLIASLLSELETFNQLVSVTEESHKVGSDEFTLTTAYIGLGVSYSTDADGQIALIGYPSGQGWTYEQVQDKKVAAEITKLIITASGAGELEFSKLPIQVR